MLFQTPTQYAVLVLLLIAGWFFGLASHPGGRKWKTRYAEERDAHAAYRKEVEARREADADRIATLERRNAELEKDRRAADVAVPTAPLPEDAPRRGPWLGFGTADDLARIRGIDAPLAAQLNEAGITSYGDIERLSDADAADLERRLGLREGTVARDEWRVQARLLAAGREEDWRGRYGSA
jgi:predicted flap endonuclease-1-like 5' DNA nuclease